MKTVFIIAFLPLVILVAMTAAIYQLIASIPPWLLVVAIAYLIYRLRRRPVSTPRRKRTNDVPAQVQGAWAHQVNPPAPTVVYLVAPDSRPQRALSEAPEPWILN